MKSIRKFPFLFIMLVILPGALGTWYYLNIASDQYETEAHFIIQGNEQSNSDMLSALTGIPGSSSSAKDALVIRDYVLSRAFLKKLDSALGIRKHFTQTSIDQYSRMPDEYSEEDFHEYWLDFVSLDHDDSAGISTLYITAFEPEMTVRVAKYIMRESEALIEKLSDQAKKDTVKFAEQELVKAESRLMTIRKQLLSLRNETQTVDLQKTAEVKTGFVSELEMELAKQEAELARLQTYLQPNTIQVKSQAKQVAIIKQQINREKQRWASTQRNRQQQANNVVSTKALNDQIAAYEELMVDKTFAEKVYEAALIASEKARIDAQQKHRYLVNIVQPQMPDDATKPDRVWEIIKLWVGCFLFWGIFSLMLSSVKDHAGFA